MEQQATEMLELIKNGMAEIPQIGSEAWNLYVSGVRVSGFINIVTQLSIIIGMVLICYIITKWYSNLSEYAEEKESNNSHVNTYSYIDEKGRHTPHYVITNSNDNDDTSTILLLISIPLIIIFTTLIILVMNLSTNLTQIITPEYYIIENIIRTLH